MTAKIHKTINNNTIKTTQAQKTPNKKSSFILSTELFQFSYQVTPHNTTVLINLSNHDTFSLLLILDDWPYRFNTHWYLNNNRLNHIFRSYISYFCRAILTCLIHHNKNHSYKQYYHCYYHTRKHLFWSYFNFKSHFFLTSVPFINHSNYLGRRHLKGHEVTLPCH